MVALTSKQEKFVLEYIKDFDNIQAYLRAFPNASYDTAKVQSNRWMNNEEVRQAISDLIKEYISEHKRIVFNGNGYSDEWLAEAERRGLPNIDNMVDTVEVLTKVVKLLREISAVSSEKGW